jgi:hypothetical protein
MDGSKGHNFPSDRCIAIKLLQEFPDALFEGVDEESILDDDEVWSRQAGWTVLKAITLLLLEFPIALFHAVDEESILGDDEVWSSQP